MSTTKKSIPGKKHTNKKLDVQIWFRAPRFWNNFLEAKASREYCTKSDLVRHALGLVFGPELKDGQPDFQAVEKSGYSRGNEETTDCSAAGTGMVLLKKNGFSGIENDPWIESMAAFVANKRSPQTHRVYRLALNQFFAFANKHPSSIQQSDVIKYRLQLETLRRAASTITQHLAAISGYYSFCCTRNLTQYNPAKGVNRPTNGAYTSATWLTTAQAKSLLAQPDASTVKGKRDYAMLLTFLLTGLRRKELANIKAGDIQKRGEKLYLTYYIKGGTKIVRDLPVKCWTAIQAYLKVSGRVTNSNSPLFVAVNGPKDRNRKDAAEKVNIQTPLTPEAIRLIVKEYSARAFGNELKVSPHTLRHTAGTLLRKSGRSIEEVQSFLKHRRIDTTRRYLHVVEAGDSEFGDCIADILNL